MGVSDLRIVGQCERNTGGGSKPFPCPSQGKALPSMGFEGKMSSVEPPSVFFPLHLPLPTFKGPTLSLGRFLPQKKEEQILFRETVSDLENLRSLGFDKVVFGAPMLIQSALEGRDRLQTPK